MYNAKSDVSPGSRATQACLEAGCMMFPFAVLEQLANAAHVVWCTAMQAQGWSGGERFDEAAMLHDGLRPFAELGALDRRNAIHAAERMVQTVLSEYQLPRGDDQEFTAEDIQLGQPVKLVPGSHRPGSSDEEVGRIMSWECEPGSVLLHSITVEWGDGDITEHIPALRDLRRI